MALTEVPSGPRPAVPSRPGPLTASDPATRPRAARPHPGHSRPACLLPASLEKWELLHSPDKPGLIKAWEEGTTVPSLFQALRVAGGWADICPSPDSGSFLLPPSFLSSPPVLPQGLCTCWNMTPDLHRAGSSLVRFGSDVPPQRSLPRHPGPSCPMALTLRHLPSSPLEHWSAPALTCWFSLWSFCAPLTPRGTPEPSRTLGRSPADVEALLTGL